MAIFCVVLCSPYNTIVYFSKSLHTELIENIFVYRMGRLCGGAHEISGIKAPLFLRRWVGVVGWGGEWVVVGWVWVGVGWVNGGVCGVLVRDVVGGG